MAENIILFFANHFGDDASLLRYVICLGVPPSTGNIKTCEKPCFKYPLPSLRYFMLSISTAGSFHFAPLGFSGILIKPLEGSSTKEVKTK